MQQSRAEIQSSSWDACGYKIALQWNDPSLETPIREIVLPDWKQITDQETDVVFSIEKEDRHIRVLQDGEVKAQSVTESSLYHTLKRICHLELATQAPDLVFVHAGVVLTEYGLLVIPAKSYSGKSTLVRSLVKLGCKYYSDEYAVLDKDGGVRPFPRAHCQRLPDGGNKYTPPSELGWSPSLGAQPMAAVVVTKFEKGASWNPRDLSSGEAVLKMLENTVCARTEPQRAIAYLANAARGAHCVESLRDESETSAGEILEWLAMANSKPSSSHEKSA
jgi:hypothetical protein